MITTRKKKILDRDWEWTKRRPGAHPSLRWGLRRIWASPGGHGGRPEPMLARLLPPLSRQCVAQPGEGARTIMTAPCLRAWGEGLAARMLRWAAASAERPACISELMGTILEARAVFF